MTASKGIRGKHTSTLPMNDRWRERIRVGLIMKRLEDQAFDELPEVNSKGLNEKGEYVPPPKRSMSAQALKAAELLLRKTVPDLTRTTNVGDPENPEQVNTKLTLDKATLKAIRDSILDDI